MKITTFKYLLFISVCIGYNSCNIKSKNKIREGIIEYDIIYLENQLGNISTSMLPKTLTLRFKDHMAMYRINGLFGAFSICNISNSRSVTNTTLLKLLDNKYFYQGKKNENACCFDDLTGIHLEYTDETKNILGFNCKKVIASFPDNDKNSFIIYYTDDIKIKKPNSTNPYSDINGVLLEFELQLNGINMRLKPRSFHKTEVQYEEFEIPPGYKKVSKEKMAQIFAELLE